MRATRVYVQKTPIFFFFLNSWSNFQVATGGNKDACVAHFASDTQIFKLHRATTFFLFLFGRDRVCLIFVDRAGVGRTERAMETAEHREVALYYLV